MKKYNFFGNILFWCSLCSFPLSFVLVCILGEINIFGVAGLIRYSWIMLLAIPISIGSLIVGTLLKTKKLKYKKNIIIAIICIPLLLIFGSYRFMFRSVRYDTQQITEVEQKVGVDLPNDVKITSEWLEDYIFTNAKLKNNTEKEIFEKTIEEDSRWTKELDSAISNAFSLNIQLETQNFQYFIFYNETLKEYNVMPKENGTYSFVFIAYNTQGQMMIMNDFKYSVSGNNTGDKLGGNVELVFINLDNNSKM